MCSSTNCHSRDDEPPQVTLAEERFATGSLRTCVAWCGRGVHDTSKGTPVGLLNHMRFTTPTDRASATNFRTNFKTKTKTIRN